MLLHRQLQRNSDYWLTGRLCFKEIFCKFLTFGYHLHDFLLLGVNLLSREGYSWTGDRMSWLNLKSLLLNPISSGTDSRRISARCIYWIYELFSAAVNLIFYFLMVVMGLL